MEYKQKKVGIWGFGVVGKSAASFFCSQGAQVSILEKQTLTTKQEQFLTAHQITLYSCQKEESIEHFFAMHDIILISAGIGADEYHQRHSHKIVHELDIFYRYWKKDIIAITGTVGKTSTTLLCSQLLTRAGLRVATGGNVGVGLFDFLGKQEDYDLALIEVSSFQLEHCQYFTPSIAVITNIHPNHLDRHGTMEAYTHAKLRILPSTKSASYTCMSLELAQTLTRAGHPLSNPIILWSAEPLTQESNVPYKDLFFIENNMVYHKQPHTAASPLFSTNLFPPLSFTENWLALTAILFSRSIAIAPLLQKSPSFELPEHRLQKIAEHNGVCYYNDSKSTTNASTLAAINQLQTAPIILLLGGISKGVPREPLIKALMHKVRLVIAFGKEADALKDLCMAHDIACITQATLASATQAAHDRAVPGDHVLFSPGGASFDLFANYQDRGNQFLAAVKELLHLP